MTTTAEDIIAGGRRDLSSICERLARLENRFANTDSKVTIAHRRSAAAMENIESIKESLEGAHESIQKLMLRVDSRMMLDLGIPQDVIDELMRQGPGEIVAVAGEPKRPFDFGADLRIDWDIVSGKMEPPATEPARGLLGIHINGVDWVVEDDVLRHAGPGDDVACWIDTSDPLAWAPNQKAELVKRHRVARAYWALSHRLQSLHAGNAKAYEDQLAELFDALGHPQPEHVPFEVDALGHPQPEPAPPIPPVQNAARYLCETSDWRLLYLNHANEWCQCPNFLQDRRHHRQTELIARAKADRARAVAYFALVDSLHMQFGREKTQLVLNQLTSLYESLGRPSREAEGEGHDAG